MNFNEAVKLTLDKFECATRDNEDQDKYYRVKDEFSDDDLTNMIFKCHDDELPNDWTYETIVGILEQMTGFDIEEKYIMYDYGYDHEIAEEEVDCFTSKLFGWYSDRPNRKYNIEETYSKGLFDTEKFDVDAMLSAGQYNRISMMVHVITNYIGELVEESDDDEEEDEEEV